MAVLFLRPWRAKAMAFFSFGYKAHPSRGVERTIIGAVGDNRDKAVLKYAESLPGGRENHADFETV